jgi:hypothetical protein
LYLRGRRQYPMLAPNGLRFGEHTLLWSAARAQLPSGWRWGSALVAHSRDARRDGPMFLFQSLHERIVRLLRCRDRIHAALLVPQDNQTAGEAIEALDYFMVNRSCFPRSQACVAPSGIPASLCRPISLRLSASLPRQLLAVLRLSTLLAAAGILASGMSASYQEVSIAGPVRSHSGTQHEGNHRPVRRWWRIKDGCGGGGIRLAVRRSPLRPAAVRRSRRAAPRQPKGRRAGRVRVRAPWRSRSGSWRRSVLPPRF